jgi:hypothetical protein
MLVVGVQSRQKSGALSVRKGVVVVLKISILLVAMSAKAPFVICPASKKKMRKDVYYTDIHVIDIAPDCIQW